METTSTIIVIIVLAVFGIIMLASHVKTVKHQTAKIVQRLGKYRKTLEAGLHVLAPFIEKIAYVHSLKEQAIDVPPQVCITKDNISVEVDGVLYVIITDAVKASYGVQSWRFAVIQLSQTMMRSEIGKIELDRTFEERETLNAAIVRAVDEASDPWGIKVNRYEIKNITPPDSIKEAMERQMKAVREKRAMIAESEGEKQARINRAEGEREAKIAQAEGDKQGMIKRAEGEAEKILKVATATAEGIKKVGTAIEQTGGKEAVALRLGEHYLEGFANIAQESTTLLLPANLTDLASMIATGATVFEKTKSTTSHPSKLKTNEKVEQTEEKLEEDESIS